MRARTSYVAMTSWRWALAPGVNVTFAWWMLDLIACFFFCGVVVSVWRSVSVFLSTSNSIILPYKSYHLYGLVQCASNNNLFPFGSCSCVKQFQEEQGGSYHLLSPIQKSMLIIKQLRYSACCCVVGSLVVAYLHLLVLPFGSDYVWMCCV